MLKLILPIFLLIIVSCSSGIMQGNNQKNLEELDKIYGKCNNPFRQFTKGQKKICEDKERAAGPDGIVDDPMSITEIINNYRGGNQTNYIQNSVNQELWEASLVLLNPYNLKISDSQGGVIATEWIMEKNKPLKRCAIKINISSQELISTGVKVKILCEEKDNESWYSDNVEFISEEKNMTLKILEIAQTINQNNKISK